jgi:TolA-binding protein
MTTPPDPLAAALRAALEEDGPRADDGDLVARAIERAAARLAVAPAPASDATEAAQPAGPSQASGQASGTAGTPTTTQRSLEGMRVVASQVYRYSLPLAAAIVGSVALTSFVVHRSTSTSMARQENGPAAAVAPSLASPPPVDEQATPRPSSSDDQSASISVFDLPSAPSTVPSARASAAPTAPSPPELSATAEELFRHANAERRAGNTHEAEELYRALLSRYPGAAESRASRVSLGRLLLEREGDARGALTQFDAYLAGSGDETLAEEARVGRALAFMHLGLREEERRAWQQLMAHHPDSLQSERARQRLEALGVGASKAPTAH